MACTITKSTTHKYLKKYVSYFSRAIRCVICGSVSEWQNFNGSSTTTRRTPRSTSKKWCFGRWYSLNCMATCRACLASSRFKSINFDWKSISSILMGIESNRIVSGNWIAKSIGDDGRNPAHNGEVLIPSALSRRDCYDGKIIPWEVVSLRLIDPVTTCCPHCLVVTRIA